MKNKNKSYFFKTRAGLNGQNSNCSQNSNSIQQHKKRTVSANDQHKVVSCHSHHCNCSRYWYQNKCLFCTCPRGSLSWSRLHGVFTAAMLASVCECVQAALWMCHVHG